MYHTNRTFKKIRIDAAAPLITRVMNSLSDILNISHLTPDIYIYILYIDIYIIYRYIYQELTWKTLGYDANQYN